jgi:predicted cupin superfamily sugar epimerase
MPVHELPPRAQAIITELKLHPHPEGGRFRETYRSALKVFSPTAGGERSALTDIFFMLCAGEVSRFHRVLHDEIWHHYEGAPMVLHLAAPDGEFLKSFNIGRRGAARALQGAVPAGHWQAAESTGEYTLVGCTVAPGFDFADFGLLADSPAASSRLVAGAPELARFM